MSKFNWKHEEQETCKLLDMEHLGGPGRPDCGDGDSIVEVKDYKRKLHKGDIARILDKDWARDGPLSIVSTSGFTTSALEYASGYDDVELLHKRGRHFDRVSFDDYWDETDEVEERNSSGAVVLTVVGIAAIGLLAIPVLDALLKPKSRPRPSKTEPQYRNRSTN